MTVETNKRRGGSKWIRRARRLSIYARDDYICVYCGTPGTVDTLSLDHLVAWRHGGSNDPKNLVTAHRTCNSTRGRRSVAKFASDAALVRIATCVKRQLPKLPEENQNNENAR